MGLKFRWFGTLVAAAALTASQARADRYDNEDGSQDPNQQQQQQQYDQEYQQQQAADPNAYAQFQDQLSPYGEWVTIEGYGRVWRPYTDDVGSDFRPYATGGQWVYTDYGWSFDSTYPWAWAAFHYGRWMSRAGYGWLWVPGSTWAPAWVDWRFGGGYVGWVPLGPYGVSVYGAGYRPSWSFVQSQYFVHPNVGTYVLPPSRVNIGFQSTVSIHNAVAVNGVHFNVGPSPQHIATAVGQPIRAVPVLPPAPGRVQQVHIASTGNNVNNPGATNTGHVPTGSYNGNAFNREPELNNRSAVPQNRAPNAGRPIEPRPAPQSNGAPHSPQGSLNRAPAPQNSTQRYPEPHGNARPDYSPPAPSIARPTPTAQSRYQAARTQQYSAQGRATAPSRPSVSSPAYRSAPVARSNGGGGRRR